MTNNQKPPFSERVARSLRVATIVLRESLRSFLNNNDFEMSAALATYSFFALVPLLFFVVSTLSGTGQFSSMLVTGIEGLIDHLFPRIRDFMSIEFSLVAGHPFTLGVAVAIMVFIAAMSLVDSLRTTFFKIFRKDPPTSLIVTQIGNIRSAIVMFLLFAVLVGAEFVHIIVSGYLEDIGVAVTGPVSVLLSICVATGCMAFFYAIFLPVKLTFVKLIGASFISALLIIGMREIFAHVLKTNPSYGETFGSLKVLFVMIVWVYYCFLVILFGAEIAVNTEKRDALLLKYLFAGELYDQIPVRLLNRFVLHYGPGDAIFNEGENGGMMFYVISGAVDIDRGGKHIRTMLPGDYFGEMSMLLGSHRSAGATASQQTQLIPISQDNFNIILRENAPIVLSILKEMAERLKDTDESLFRR
ncbi:MAG: YhjD/YihY/BrkB family envelope integrity protein [Syntrophorhabdaceae bacterium]